MKLTKVLILLMLSQPVELLAEWQVVTHRNTDTDTSIEIAHIVNEDNYRLEIYQDNKNIVRLRFGMSNNFRLNNDTCPTFRIDRNELLNTSINEAPCLSHALWAEYIIGYVIDNNIVSGTLVNIMNGKNISFLFRSTHDGYYSTDFSLNGSRDALLSVLPDNIRITR